MYIANIHSTALCLLGGHSLSVGRINQSACIVLQSVRRIMAISFLVLSQFKLVTPHSVIRCLSVSVWVQCSHLSVGESLMVCSLARVGIISCITLNHVTFAVSGIGASCILVHTVVQSALGHIRITRSLGVSVSIINKRHMVVYNLHLYARVDSIAALSGIYAESCAYIRRYSNCNGILCACGGFASRFSSPQFLSHNAVIDIPSALLIWNR